MPKKNKLNELDQVDGKHVEGENCFQTLDALLGEDNSNPYKTSKIEDYENYINQLNTTDLQRHAEKVGLVPSVEKRVLKERLLREFRRFQNSRMSISKSDQSSNSFLDASASLLSASAQRILREGA
jgi:hypothetical protein